MRKEYTVSFEENPEGGVKDPPPATGDNPYDFEGYTLDINEKITLLPVQSAKNHG